MRHFVGYHNSEKMGKELGWEPGQEEFVFWSRRASSYLNETKDNRVWAIGGTQEGKKKTFRLWGYYTVSKVKYAGDKTYHVYGTDGFVFDSPIALNDFNWFPALLKEAGYFGFGVNETKIESVIDGLTHLAANPPEKLQTTTNQKDGSDTQTQYGIRSKDLLPEEIGSDEEMYVEGAETIAVVNAYERNTRARQRCIEHYGLDCFVCGFNFKQAYGEAGDGTIHVHHLKPLSEVKKSYRVDPIKDLRPICPNCHAMIHSKFPIYAAAEIEQMLGRKERSSKN